MPEVDDLNPQDDPVDQSQTTADDPGESQLDKDLSEAFNNPDNIDAGKGKPNPEQIEREDSAPKEEPAPKEESILDPQDPPSKEKPAKELGTPPHPDEIKAPSNVGQRSLEGWGALHKNYKNIFGILKSREDDNKKLKALVAEKEATSTKAVEELRQEIEGLKAYRAMFDATSDPEFQKQYETPLTTLKSELESILSKVGVAKESIATLDFTNPELMDAIALQIEENRDRLTSKRFLNKAEDYIKLHENKQKALDEQKGKFKEIQAQKEQQTFAQRAAEQGAISRHIEAVAASKSTDGKEQFPFLVRKEAAVGAPQAEIAKIDAHNEMVDNMHKRLERVLSVQTPQERAEVGVAAVASSYYRQMWSKSEERAKSLEDELKKVSAAGSERRPGGAPKASGRAPESLSLEDALAAEFPGMK